MSWVGIQPDAPKRARLVDAEMGWPNGLTIGKMVMVWQETQALRIETATKNRILLWAGMPVGSDADKWLAQLMSKDIHFLEQAPLNELKIVGNKAEIEKIYRQIEKSIKGGKASAASRQHDDEPDVEALAEPQVEPVVQPNGQPQVHPTPTPTPIYKLSANKDDHQDGSFTPMDLLEAWNANCGSLDKVARLSKSREAKIKARRKEAPNLGYWVDLVKRLALSDLANGRRRNDKYPGGWFVSFEWLIKNDNNHLKVAEGIFDNKKASKPAPIVFTGNPNELV